MGSGGVMEMGTGVGMGVGVRQKASPVVSNGEYGK